MLNNDTRQILKQLAVVNNQMILANEMYGCNEYKSIYFKAELNKLDQIPDTFGIYDASNFLSALDLLEDPAITFDDKTKMITATDANSTMTFLTSLVDSLENVKINPKIISSTVAVPSVLETALTPDVMNKIKKAQAVFKNFDTLWIDNQDRTTYLKLGTQNSFSKSNNDFKIKLDTPVNTKDFSIAIPLDSLMNIPVMDYTLRVKHNAEKDAYRVVVDNELLTFILSLQKD